MNDTPDQTQIEPSAEAVKILADYDILEGYARAFLRAAYAIDFAPIIEERDQMRLALEWYGEQARLCRLIHSEGDIGRALLDADGGRRARAALEPKP